MCEPPLSQAAFQMTEDGTTEDTTKTYMSSLLLGFWLAPTS